MTDQAYLREYAEHSSDEAFAALVRRHVDLVYGTALRKLSDPEAASEVAQNVFVALARKASWLCGHMSLAAWLHKTTLLESQQWWRSELRRRARERTATELGTTMKYEESLLKSLTGVLDEGLTELPENERQALLLRFFEERSHREIGSLLGTSEDAARKRVDKAVDHLTRFFQKRGYAVPAAAVTLTVLRGASHAAPAGLSSALAAVGASSGSTVAAGSFGILFTKFMALTKTQTIVTTLVVAAVPVGLQWSSTSTAETHRAALHDAFAQTQNQLAANQSSLDQFRRRQRALEAGLANLRSAIARQHDRTELARANADAALYVWSDDSPYVRVPKTLATNLRLTGSHLRPTAPEGADHRAQDPAVHDDGSLSDVLVETLDITDEEHRRIHSSIKAFQGEYETLARNATRLNDAPPPELNVGSRESRTMYTAAFPDAGQELQQRLRTAIESAIGPERGAVVWQQAEPVFQEKFNLFGALEKYETVAVAPGNVSYWRVSRRPGESGFSNWMNTSGQLHPDLVPEPFKEFVAGSAHRNQSKITTDQ